MLFNRKSQGLSFNMVIIAAILLLVLVVLSVMFIKNMSGFSNELGGCRGQCEDEGACQVIAPGGHDSCDSALTPTDTGGVSISLAGRSVCCLTTK